MTKKQYLQMIERKNRRAEEVQKAMDAGWRPSMVAEFTAPRQSTAPSNEAAGFVKGLAVSGAATAALLGGVVLSWFL